MTDAGNNGRQKPASPFWTFSLKIYGKPGVPPACLTIQDGSGVAVDVNVVLFVLFCAAQGRRLSPADASRIVTAVEDWRVGVVVPLRTARRGLKEPPAEFDTPATAELRLRVKAVELEAERLQQETLFASLPAMDLGTAGEPAEAAAANLATYSAAIGATFDAAAVRTLLDAFNSVKD